MAMEEYTTTLDHLMIKCDIVEAKEHTITYYIGGLCPDASILDVWQRCSSSFLGEKTTKGSQDK